MSERLYRIGGESHRSKMWEMIERPRFKSHFHVQVRSPELVVAVSESRTEVMEGRLHPLLVPWIDGTRSAAEIAAAAGSPVTALDAAFGIALLEERGLIEEDGPPVEPWQSDFRERAGASRAPVGRAAVQTFGELPAGPLEQALESLGVIPGNPADLTVVLTSDYLLPGIAPAEPWMPVKASGSVIWFGPVFDGDSGACWECLKTRLREWRQAEAFVPDRQECDDRRPATAMPSAALGLALGLAAMEAFRYLSGTVEPGGRPILFTFDLARMRLDRHAVTKQEACAKCGGVSDAQPARMGRLQERPAHSADAVLERFGHLVSPITGIVGSLEPYGVAAPGVAAACSAPYLFLPGARSRALTRRVTSGKGATRAEAESSALCEALERYSGVWRGSETTRRARYRDLGADAVHPASLLHFSAEQYRNREAGNRQARPEQWVPAPFDEDRAIDWTPAWSLPHQRHCWVPAAYCYYGYPLPPDHTYCAADSNGCAAGSSPEEAALQGLLELVERDAVALWWYNRVARPAIAPESLGPMVHSFARHYAVLGRCLRLFDITSDLGIPVFAAISWRRWQGQSALAESPDCERELILGFGAAFHADEAAQRAVTEMNQFLDLNRAANPRCRLGDDPRDRDFLMSPPCTSLRAASSAANGDTLLQKLQSLGMDVLALDQTRAGVGMPVVRMMAPGLRHFWPRLGPGRLYSVPVQMGWRTQAPVESEMNRTAFFC